MNTRPPRRSRRDPYDDTPYLWFAAALCLLVIVIALVNLA